MESTVFSQLNFGVFLSNYIEIENDLKGNENCFELARGSSYRGFELLGVDFIWGTAICKTNYEH